MSPLLQDGAAGFSFWAWLDGILALLHDHLKQLWKDGYGQARECLRIFSKNGGYVFNTIHNIVPGVPVENVDALARAVRDHNRG